MCPDSCRPLLERRLFTLPSRRHFTEKAPLRVVTDRLVGAVARLPWVGLAVAVPALVAECFDHRPLKVGPDERHQESNAAPMGVPAEELFHRPGECSRHEIRKVDADADAGGLDDSVALIACVVVVERPDEWVAPRDRADEPIGLRCSGREGPLKGSNSRTIQYEPSGFPSLSRRSEYAN